ncbi:HAD-IIB family hydrolase [Georgenia sp. TF02-10]|uniref:HAD-IIB family hydrolase n=1 Tax=Georgenia sp. TF02-10 TaxID=2917725 RepID=UPI001FA7CCFB|nr:HAD-IIB family hydrolase [Georgenia sp. TF02-10]UNX53654.1 HAD-IIB family hydrolase [Georgenia sp. TF02-10]
MPAPALIAFDLDDTLAPSKSPMPAPMAGALVALLDHLPVCIISGGHFGQFRDQVLAHLPATPEQLGRLHLMPTCGTRYLRHDGDGWRQVYAHDLTAEERAAALASVEGEARRLGLWTEQPWGDILEDRGSQITFSALGQQAPLDAKKAWDPTGAKKTALRDAVARLLPGLEVRSGGSTSVDITRKGVDKAYGMARLSEQTGIALTDMLFVGDRLDPAGNDYPVVRLGVPTRAVTGWEETADLVTQLVAELAASEVSGAR